MTADCDDDDDDDVNDDEVAHLSGTELLRPQAASLGGRASY